MKAKSKKKGLKLSALKLDGNLKATDFKLRKLKKLEHASLCAGSTFGS